VGGWPELVSVPAPADSDADGMPDNWEDAHGLNKNSASDAQLLTVDGKFPNLEVYINNLVTEITDDQVKEAIIISSWLTPVRKDMLKFYIDDRGHLKIDHTWTIRRMEIFSITGTLLKAQISNITQVDVDISGLKPGIYIVRVTDNKNLVHSAEFIRP
jgi:hypothetical protein